MAIDTDCAFVLNPPPEKLLRVPFLIIFESYPIHIQFYPDSCATFAFSLSSLWVFHFFISVSVAMIPCLARSFLACLRISFSDSLCWDSKRSRYFSAPNTSPAIVEEEMMNALRPMAWRLCMRCVQSMISEIFHSMTD